MEENISQITWCTERHETIAKEQGIVTWRDPRLNAEMLNIPKTKVDLVNNIIKANRDNKFFNLQYQFTGKEVFLDIENTPNYIFMIGVWSRDIPSNFCQWTLPYLNKHQELKMLKEYNKFIHELNPDRIYIWHCHEKTYFKKKEKEYNIKFETEKMFDFCEYLRTNNYAIPGLFNHSLKSVGKLFHSLNYITTIWGQEVVDGKKALDLALEKYKKRLPLDDIKEYNYYDIKVMQEIIEHFKTLGNLSNLSIETSMESTDIPLTGMDHQLLNP